MVGFLNGDCYERIAVDVPDKVINSMILTPSPLFADNFHMELHKTIQQKVQIGKSPFNGKLNIRTICNQCEFKTEQNTGE
jgi:hypothetical protein